MTSVNGPARQAQDDDHLAWLMERTWQRLGAELARTAAHHPSLRRSHLRLLGMMPAGGARHSDLAATAGMTKQGLGQLVAHLQEHGYVETVRDPADGRVRLVRPTARGRRAKDDVVTTIADLEARWEAEVGPRRYATFRRVMDEIGRAAG